MAAVATPAAGYIWEDPGDSIMVEVSLDLVERLGAAMEQGLGVGPRGTEIGGILLGRRMPGFGRAVLVEDFEPVRCEHLRGESYTLSPGERHMLGGQLRRRRPLQVVGFFRSHTRPGLYLDQDDFAVFSRYFQDDWQVFLVVRPSPMDASMDGPATGGFFFWEDGDVNRRSPYRQFPFDAKRLAVGGFPLVDEQPAAALSPRTAPVAIRQTEARVRRKLPPLPWLVVPVIAGLFLLAGLFVSQNQEVGHVAGRAIQPVQPLLPEPVASAAVSVPPVTATVPAAATEIQPIAPPKAKLAERPRPTAPVATAHAATRVMEPPPALPATTVKLEPKLWAMLPSKVNSAPPREADVSYEAPHPGVFKRALHKIEGEGDPGAFVPASPTHKVAPVKTADAALGDRPVDVKVFIDDAGNVTRAQLLTKGSGVASEALTAARGWRFTPARKHDKPVASEMLLHFQF
jgi:Gram-negative bacterial TonB protein C-terminal